jgi:hypothetical protein
VAPAERMFCAETVRKRSLSPTVPHQTAVA